MRFLVFLNFPERFLGCVSHKEDGKFFSKIQDRRQKKSFSRPATYVVSIGKLQQKKILKSESLPQGFSSLPTRQENELAQKGLITGKRRRFKISSCKKFAIFSRFSKPALYKKNLSLWMLILSFPNKPASTLAARMLGFFVSAYRFSD